MPRPCVAETGIGSPSPSDQKSAASDMELTLSILLAATITGNRGPTYTGTIQAAKLKIMGVDVFSAGDWSEQNAEPVRFEDRALGIYKKLTVRDGRLAGVILVGDTADSHRYME